MDYRLTDDSYCFICGERNPKGLNLSFKRTDTGVTAEFILDKEYQGYKGIIHGGLIAAILDEAMIKAANQKGYNAVTAELTVRFMNPLMTDQKAWVDGKVLKESRKVLKATASLKREGVIIAEAEGKLYVPSVE